VERFCGTIVPDLLFEIHLTNGGGAMSELVIKGKGKLLDTVSEQKAQDLMIKAGEDPQMIFARCPVLVDLLLAEVECPQGDMTVSVKKIFERSQLIGEVITEFFVMIHAVELWEKQLGNTSEELSQKGDELSKEKLYKLSLCKSSSANILNKAFQLMAIRDQLFCFAQSLMVNELETRWYTTKPEIKDRPDLGIKFV
jgi:hypothetical protein